MISEHARTVPISFQTMTSWSTNTVPLKRTVCILENFFVTRQVSFFLLVRIGFVIYCKTYCCKLSICQISFLLNYFFVFYRQRRNGGPKFTEWPNRIQNGTKRIQVDTYNTGPPPGHPSTCCCEGVAGGTGSGTILMAHKGAIGIISQRKC